MITVFISMIFIVMVFGLFWYIFRGVRQDDQNPIWGNLFSSFLNVLLCIILAYSFMSGNIMDMSVVSNATYTVNYQTLDTATAYNISSNASEVRQYILGKSGSGMYTISAIDSMTAVSPYINNFTVSYTTKDIVYLQMQDWGMFYLFCFLACVSAALFLWFVWPLFSEFFGFGGSDGSSKSDSEEGGEAQ